jgi:hypothetical protein
MLGNNEFNHLIIILIILSCESLFKSGFHIELAEAVWLWEFNAEKYGNKANQVFKRQQWIYTPNS